MKNLLVMALIAIVSCTCVQAQTVDPSYPATVTSNASVEGGILLSDGKYILYGEFSHLNGVQRPGIVKFNADGSVDNTFNIGTGPNGTIMAGALQTDGKILLAGRFTSFNGVNRSFLIRLNADGSVDNTFASNIVIDAGGVDINLLVQPDGKIVVTGPIRNIDGMSYSGSLARLNTNGSKDALFNTNASLVQALGLQSDGKILIGGYFTKGIARLNSDGSSDATFTPTGGGFNGTVNAIQVSSTGKIFVGGSFTEFNGAANKYLACLDNTGALDATWLGNGKPNNPARNFHLLPDGKLLVAGGMSTYGGTAAKSPWRLNTDGSLDLTGAGGFGVANVSANAGGDILVTGSFTTYDSQPRNGVAVVASNGTLKSMSVQPNFQKAAHVLAVKAHGVDKFLIGHLGDEINGNPSTGLARLNLDGTIDATFNGNSKPNDYVSVITIDQNDKVLIGGAFSNYNGTATGRIARLSSDGTLDAGFAANTSTGFNSPANAIVEQADGKILVGGTFATFNGVPCKGIARLNADGTLDASFNTANGFVTATSFWGVEDIAVLSDGKILVAGEFNSFAGNAVKNFIRLNVDGSFDNTFQINVYAGGPNSVNDMLVLPDGKILIGGMFRHVGNATFNANNLALLSSEGAVLNGYESTNFFGVEHMERQSDGKILVLDRNTGLRRLNADATVDPSFTGISLSSYPEGVFTSGNTIIVGGWLSKAGGHVATGFAKVDLPSTVSSAPTSLATGAVAQSSISLNWSDNGTDETGFYLERSTETNTNYQVVATLPANATTYNNTGLTANTKYYYRLRTFNAAGNSAYTNEVSATTLMTPPLAPSSLVLTVVNAGEVRLTWTDNSSNESGFEIHRSVANNTSYTLLTTTSAGATTYSDVAVTEGTRYYYRVRAVNNGGASGFTASSSAIAANPVPATPGNLQATAIDGTQVNLSWSDNSSNETGFEIERADGQGAFQLIQTTTSNVSSYSDMTVTHSVTYYYRVRSIYGASKSFYTQQVSVIPPAPVPAAPTNLVLTSIAPSSIGVSWVDNASDEVDFVIERSLSNNTSYSQIAIVSENGTQYTDATVASGATYYYRVKARNAFGSSAGIEASMTAGNFNMGNKTITTCEGNLFDSGNSGNYSNNESYTLRLYPATEGSSIQLVFSSFATDAADQLSVYNGITAHADSLIGTYFGTTAPGTIQALNKLGALTLVFQSNSGTVNSGWSATISCGIFTIPPGNVQLNVPHTGQVSISWTDNAINETGYVVERSLTGIDADFTNIATLNAGATGYSDNQVTENTTYYYRVKATGPEGDSDFAPIRGVAFGEGGIWRLKQEFDGIARTDAVGFAVGGKGYVGLGFAGGAQTSNFRSYDPVTDSWSTQVDFFGGSVRSEAAAFVVGSKAYVGTGQWFDREKDLWEYDPSLNAWTQKTDFGGTARIGAIGFAIGDKGYLGLGTDDAGYTKDFWQFDPVANTWTPIASFPGDARDGAVVFVIGNFAYAGTGSNGTTKLKDFYKYDPAANTWTAIAEFPGAARAHAVAFEVDGKGYVGTGESFNDLKDFWSYDPTTNTWQQIVNFGGSARYVATAFALDNKGYVSTGFDGGNKKDLWEFTAANIEAAPIAPSDLTAAAFSASQIDLQWIDNSSNETGFVIERSATNSENFQEIATLPVDATSYSDTGLDAGTTYYYRVKINTAVGSSAYTASAIAATLPLPPAAPSNLTASLGVGLEIQLSWTDNAIDETGYVIERSQDDNTGFSSIATLSAGVTSYNDLEISYSTTYYYRVKSTNDGGSSQYSNEATATTPTPPIIAPSALTAEALSHRSVQLRWTDNSDNESFFSVYRSTNPSGEFTHIGGTGDNATEFTDTWNVVENTTYYYKVRAETVHYQSEYTAIASATTPKSMPAPPTNLTASYEMASDDIILEWVDASDNEEHFVIEKSLGGSDFIELTTTTGTTYTDEDPGTTFQVFYRVAAKNSAGTSSFSNTAHIVITGIEPGAGIAGVRAYPNPVVDKVTVEWSSADRGEVQISFFDLAGRELKAVTYEKIGQDFLGQVDLEGLTGNAVLMMKLTMGEKMVIRRIVVR